MSNRNESENSSIRATSAGTSRGKESRLVTKKHASGTKRDSGTVDMINMTTSTPTPGRSGQVVTQQLSGTTHAPHAKHHLMAKESNPKFEFLNDSAWDRRNIEAFYMKHS